MPLLFPEMSSKAEALGAALTVLIPTLCAGRSKTMNVRREGHPIAIGFATRVVMAMDLTNVFIGPYSRPQDIMLPSCNLGMALFVIHEIV